MADILAKKINMTQVWTEDGKVVPVTVLDVSGADLAGSEVGAIVDVWGTTRGRGFAGPMKRHGFHGAPASHGHDHPRAVGSIGHRFPQHVRPGKRMAGHMGASGATAKHSMIIAMDVQKNLMFVKGGVPGSPGSKVKVKLTGKKKDMPKIVEYGVPAEEPKT